MGKTKQNKAEFVKEKKNTIIHLLMYFSADAMERLGQSTLSLQGFLCVGHIVIFYRPCNSHTQNPRDAIPHHP